MLTVSNKLKLFHWRCDRSPVWRPLYALNSRHLLDALETVFGELPAGLEIHRNGLTVPFDNPASCANTRKGDDVTDRAKRYRANQAGCVPDGERVCMYCEADSDVMVHHLDGDEDNGEKDNLAYACRSCNQVIANQHIAAGVGRRNDQYNPSRKRSKGSPKVTFGQFAAAVSTIGAAQTGNGAEQMPLFSAREIIRSMSPAEISSYQKEVWRLRKQRYGQSGRKDGGAVPF